MFAYGMVLPYHGIEVPCKMDRKQKLKIVPEILPEKSTKLVMVNAGKHEFEVMIINEEEVDRNMTTGETVGVIREYQKAQQNHIEQKSITEEMVVWC